jgi:hypothetical protein
MFFIVGCPRSGTTLLQRLLDAHPEVAVAPETFFVRRFWKQRERYGGERLAGTGAARLAGDVAALPEFDEMGLDAEAFQAAARSAGSMGEVFGRLLAQFADRRGARHVGEKTPDHALHLPVLRRWFPSSKAIHLVRDPRAVVNSLRSVPWTSGYRWRDAEVWVEHVRAVRAAAPGWGDRLHTVRFEGLLQKPEAELRRLCGAMGWAYDPAMLAFHDRDAETVNVDREPWKERATQPIDPSVATRWTGEMTAAEQAEVEAVAGAEMRHWGYTPSASPVRRQLGRLQRLAQRPLWKLRLAADEGLAATAQRLARQALGRDGD